ncbi:hypothetical protein DPEC_G00367470, partial [Dallia pectoralis]
MWSAMWSNTPKGTWLTGSTPSLTLLFRDWAMMTLWEESLMTLWEESLMTLWEESLLTFCPFFSLCSAVGGLSFPSPSALCLA